MIGKILEPQLLVITKRAEVGFHPLNPNSSICRIIEIAAIPISQNSSFVATQLQLDKCSNVEHQTVSGPLPAMNSGLNLLQKAAGQKMIKSTVNSLKASINLKKEAMTDDMMERRLLEEILRMFNENGGFYYCNGMDLTNSIQRICENKTKDKKHFDERFFWNRHLLEDLIAQNDENASHWIQPIIQGKIN